MDAIFRIWTNLNTAEQLALLGVIVIWIVYRADRWSQRRGLIDGVTKELTLHRPWVGSDYSLADKGKWDKDASHLPFKLGTVAIDDAIVRGPSLLLSGRLTSALVVYRQLVGHYNQLVDQLMAFHANPDIWVPNPPQPLVEHTISLIEGIHILGIGNAQSGGAHASYIRVGDALGEEQDTKVLPLIWAVTGINLFILKRWGRWL